MKALAITLRQPWAELVIRGDKAMDLRTWATAHRGELAIHASKTAEAEACNRLGLEPSQLPRGAVVGIVKLVDVLPLDPERYKMTKTEHLGVRSFREPMFGWCFEAPQRLHAAWPARGRLKLFHVEIPDALILDEGAREAEVTHLYPDSPFQLFVVPDRRASAVGMGYGMALYQRQVNGQLQLRLPYAGGPSQDMEKVAELSADRLRVVADEVIQALREAGFRPTELSASRKEPFSLPEEVGVRLGLLFLAVRPVSKVVRAEAIAAGIQSMPVEEAYYWYSKAAHGPQAQRAQRALRVLLSEGG